VRASDAKSGSSLSQFLDSFFTKPGDDPSVTGRKTEAPPRQANRAQLDVVMTQIERRMSDDLTTLKKSWLAPLNLSSTRKNTDETAAADLKKKVEEGLAASNTPKKKKSSSSNGDRLKVPASPRTNKGRVQRRDSSGSQADESEGEQKPSPETEVPQTAPKKAKKTLADVLDNQAPEHPLESRDAMSLASSIVLAKRRLSSSHKSESGDHDVEKKMLEILVSDGA
jgi:hypothetical protein